MPLISMVSAIENSTRKSLTLKNPEISLETRVIALYHLGTGFVGNIALKSKLCSHQKESSVWQILHKHNVSWSDVGNGVHALCLLEISMYV
jgi:hypothetical protein